MIQKKVFGAGYPSLPTLTIEEFYEQKVQDGTFQIPGSGGYVSMIELQDTREC
jgi:immunoglobulin-binding protein 1